MKYNLRRVLAMIMCVFMLISSLPMNALAEAIEVKESSAGTQALAGATGRAITGDGVSNNAVTIKVGESVTLSGSNSSNSHAWSATSGNTSAINFTSGTTSQTVTIQGASVGEVVITHTYYTWSMFGGSSKKTETITITVEAVEAQSISISGASTVMENKTTQLTLTAEPEGAEIKDVVWTSSNPDVASVDASTGVVTGHTVGGTATITATMGELTDTHEISVVEFFYPDSMYITGDVSVKVGGTLQLSLVTVPEGYDTSDVVWSSSDTSVATVDQNGLVRGVKTSSDSGITITATLGEMSTNYTVYVLPSSYSNCTVYVYIKLDGDVDKTGLEINGNGWYTMGTINLYLPDPAVIGDTAYHNDYVSLAAIKTALKNINRHSSCASFPTDVLLNNTSWYSPYGLKVDSGASSYSVSGAQWHLDGYLDIDYKFNVEYFYSDDGVSYTEDTSAAYSSYGTANQSVSSFTDKSQGGVYVLDHVDVLNANGALVEENAEAPYFTLTNSTNEYTLQVYYKKAGKTYTVKHYLQQANGLYKLEYSETISGRHTGDFVTAKPNDYTGYTENTSYAERVPSGTVLVDNSLVLKLYYDRVPYDVTYISDGATFGDVETYYYKDTVTIKDAVPTKAGYTFAGWETDDVTGESETYQVGGTFTMPASNVTLYAVWEQSDFTVTYLVDGVQSGEVETYTYGNPVIVRDPATSTGYTFSGWKTSDLGTANQALAAGATFSMPAKDVVIEGTFAINQYGVSYKYTGDVPADADPTPAPQDYDYNAPVTVEATPAPVEGFTFGGWETDDATVTDGAFSMPADDVVISGNWTRNSHDVSYNYKGNVPEDADKLPAATVQPYATSVAVAATPAPVEGYTFTGWETDDATVTDGAFSMPDKDVELVGTWTINQYKVTYDLAGGTSTDNTSEKSYDYNAEVTVKTAPTKTGYTFDGWTSDDVSSLTAGGTFTMPASDVHIVANWKANTDTAYKVEHYTQDLVAEGAVQTWTLVETEELTGTTDATVTASPKTYAGFTFDGNVEGTLLSDTVKPDGSTVLRVYYTRNTDTAYKVEHYTQDLVAEGAVQTWTLVETDEGLTGTTGAAAKYEKNEYAGFTYDATANKFYGETDADSEGLEAMETATILGNGSLVIKLYYTRNTNTKYTVEYYYSDVKGVYPETATSNDERTGTTGEKVSVTGEDKTSLRASHVLDEEATAKLYEGVIAGNGSLVLKVFFKYTGGTNAPITMKKVWVAPEGKDLTSATLTLMRKVGDGEGEAVDNPLTIGGIQMGAAAYLEQSKTTADLPTYDVNGDKYTYYMVESAVGENFNVDTSAADNVAVGDTATITNTWKNDTPKSEKTANDNKFTLGQEIVYTIEYYNHTNTAATIIITDDLDDALSYVGATVPTGVDGNVVHENGTVTWTLNNIPAYIDGSVTLTVVVNKKINGEDNKTEGVTNTVSCTVGKETNPGGSVYIDILQPKIVITKAATPKTIDLNGIVSYTINVQNTGELDLTNVVVTDPMFAKAEAGTLKVDGEDATLNGDDIALSDLTVGSDPVVITYQYKAVQNDILSGGISNTAEVTSIVKDDKLQDNYPAVTDEDTADVATAPMKSVLSATKVVLNQGTGVDGAFRVGDEIQYKVTITNTGNVTAKDINIADTLADEGENIEGFDDYLGNNTFDIEPNGEKVILYSYTITEAGKEIGNVVSVESAATATPVPGTTPTSTPLVTPAPTGTIVPVQSKQPLTIYADSKSKVYDGDPLTAENFAVKEGDGAQSTFAPETTYLPLANGDQVTVNVSGTITNVGPAATNAASGVKIQDKAGVDRTGAYKITYEEGSLEITKRPITITVNNDTKVYGTKDPAFSGSITSGTLVNTGDLGTITYSRTNEAENVGEYNDVLTANYTANDNYDVTVVPGDFTITKAGEGGGGEGVSWGITANGGSKPYDGTALKGTYAASVTSDTTYQFSTDGGNTWSSDEPSQTDAGSITVTVKASNPNFVDITAEYTLTVTKRPVTLTSATATKEFDGTALTNGTVTPNTPDENTGFVEGEGVASYNVTGSQTNVGDSNNTFTYTLKENTKLDNYTITIVPGKLTVSVRDITIVAATDEKDYDGEELTNDKFAVVDGTVTAAGSAEFASPNSLTWTAADGSTSVTINVAATISGSQTEVGSSTNIAVEDTAVISAPETAAEGVDKSALETLTNYSISYVDGTLTVKDDTVDNTLVITKNDGKADDYKYALGETVTFTITVKNIYAEAKDITITEIDGVTLAQSAFEAVAAGATVTTTATYTITEADMIAGEFENTATATIGEKVYTANDTVNTADVVPELTITKADGEANNHKYDLNETVVYTITVSNGGNITLNDVTVEDAKFANAVSGSIKLNGEAVTATNNEVTVGELVAETGAATITYEYVITEADIAAGSVVNTASASGIEAKENGAPVEADPATETVQTVAKNASIEIIKVADKTSDLAVGDTVTYTITVTNTGNLTVELDVTDPQADASESLDKTITLVPAVLANGTDKLNSETYTVIHTITDADVIAGEYVNTATAEGTASNGDEVEVSDSVTVNTVDASEGIEVTKTIVGESSGYEVGDTATYAITVKNIGTLTLNNVQIMDQDINATLSVGTATGATLDGNVIKIASMAPGAEITGLAAEYTVTQDDVDAGSYENTVEATATAANNEPVEDTDVETITMVAAAPALTVTKEDISAEGAATGADGESYRAGDVITYKVVVTNTGNVTVKDIALEDTKVTLNEKAFTLAPGASKEFTYTYTVIGSDLGTVDGEAQTMPNTVTATGKDPEGEGVTNFAIETVNVINKIPVVVKAMDGEWTYDGQSHSQPGYTITVGGDGAIEKVNGAAYDDGEVVFTVTTSGSVTNNEDDCDNVIASAIAADKVGGSHRSENYEITTKTPGSLVINPRPVTITSADDTKAYNGTPLTNDTITYSQDGGEGEDKTYGFVSREGVTVDVTGSQTLVGSSKNTFTYTFNEGTLENNYTITPDYGTLTVTDSVETDDTEKVIKKTHEGTEYGLGETVTFTITVTNIYAEAKTITISEQEGVTLTNAVNGEVVFENVSAGKTVSTTATYVITEADLIEESFTNTATVSFSGGSIYEDGDTVDLVDAEASIKMEKKVVGKTSGYALGEKVTFEITVTNTGNLTVKNITVTDEAIGLNATIASLAPNETSEVFKGEHVITEDDILTGLYTNTASAAGRAVDGTEVSAKDSEIVTTVAKAASLAFSKEVVTEGGLSAATGTDRKYQSGDVITYKIVVTNTGNVTVSGIKLEDSLVKINEQLGDDSDVNFTGDNLSAEFALAPGASKEFTYTYTVDEDDVLAGNITNELELEKPYVTPAPTTTAIPAPSPSADPTTTPAPTAIVTPAPTKIVVESEDEDPVLEVVKTVDGAASGYDLGDTVNYTITVKNTGNLTISNIAITDDDSNVTISGTSTGIELAPGEETSVRASYTIKQKDILAGLYTNTARAAGVASNGEEMSASDTEIVRTVAVDAELDYTKSIIASTPSGNGGKFRVGDTITYEIMVKNIGNVTMTGIDMSDSLVNLKDANLGAKILDANKENKKAYAPFSLEPNQIIYIQYTYTVQVSDIEARSVKNGIEMDTATTPAPTTTTTPAPSPDASDEPTATPTPGPIATPTAPVEVEKTAEPMISVIVVPNSNTWEYDKVTHSEDSYKITIKIGDDVKVNGAEVGADGKYVYTDGNIKDTIIVNIAGSITDVGTKDNTATLVSIKDAKDADRSGNYTVDVTAKGKLTVTKRELTVIAKNDSKAYDGDKLAAEEFVVLNGTKTRADIPNGTDFGTDPVDIVLDSKKNTKVTVSATVEAEDPDQQILVGTETNKVKKVKIDDNEYTVAQLADLKNYKVTVIDGLLTVTDENINPTDDADKPVVKKQDGDAATKYALGETVDYTITIKNIYEDERDITITEKDEVKLKSYTYNGTTTDISGTSATIENVAGGATVTVAASYVVTEAAIRKGEFENEVSVEFGGKSFEAEETIETEERDASFTIAKADSKAADHRYAWNETVNYTFTITNTGNQTLKDIVIVDNGATFVANKNFDVSGDGHTATMKGTLAAETAASDSEVTSVTITATYTIDEDDILAGEYFNEATANAKENETGTAVEEKTANETVYTEVIDGNLSVTKTITNKGTGEDGKFRAGDVIEYMIKVENVGNVTVTNAKITDYLNGEEYKELEDVVITLGPKESKEITYFYTVQPSDVANNETALEDGTEGGDPVDNKVVVSGGTTPDPKPSSSATVMPTPKPTGTPEATADAPIATRKAITITAVDAFKTYDAEPLTANAITNGYKDNLDDDDKDAVVSVTVEGSIVNVGSTPNVPNPETLSIKVGEVDRTDNYDAEFVDGTLTVYRRGVDPENPEAPLPEIGDDAVPESWRVVIRAKDNKVEYDGEVHNEWIDPNGKLDGFTIEGAGLAKDSHKVVSIEYEGGRKNAGEYANEIRPMNAVIIDTVTREDVTANYALTYLPGDLKILPKEVKVQVPDVVMWSGQNWNEQMAKALESSGVLALKNGDKLDAKSVDVILGTLSGILKGDGSEAPYPDHAYTNQIVGKNKPGNLYVRSKNELVFNADVLDLDLNKLVILDGEGNDITGNYIFSKPEVVELGDLTVKTCTLTIRYRLYDNGKTNKKISSDTVVPYLSVGDTFKKWSHDISGYVRLNQFTLEPSNFGSKVSDPIEPGMNYMTLYYGLPRTSYTINYIYLDDPTLNKSEVVGNVAIGAVVSDIGSKIIANTVEGYTHLRTEGLTLIVQAGGTSRINVYYTKTALVDIMDLAVPTGASLGAMNVGDCCE